MFCICLPEWIGWSAVSKHRMWI